MFLARYASDTTSSMNWGIIRLTKQVSQTDLCLLVTKCVFDRYSCM